jgi:hypothetical protein
MLLSLHLAAEEEVPAETEPDTAPTEEPAPAPARPALEERSQTNASALQRQLPSTEQQQLQTANEQFLALWLPANSAEAAGLVILLPGDSETADWPQAIGPLRRKLPDAGWHSLSLSLPDPQEPPLPVVPPEAIASPPETSAAGEEQPDTAADTAADADADADEPAQEEAAETPPDESEAAVDEPPSPPLTLEEQREAHAKRVLARIQAAVDFAQQQQPKSIVLLGHGSGAYWAARYLSEAQPKEVRNLLLVAASEPPGFTPVLEELVPTLKLATGDFYYKDRPADRSAALKRLNAGKRQQHPAYVQVAMKALPGNIEMEQEQLFRRIRGWLKLHPQAQ